jgi:hypothetical protein
MTTTDLTAMTPVEVDTVLAEIYTRLYTNWDKQTQIIDWIKDYEKGLRKKAEGGREALMYSGWTEERLAELEQKYEALQEEGLRIEAETYPYESEYRRRPWSRFFHVTNSNGHIHRSMHCTTCFPTTRYAWLTEMSGQTEAEALQDLGKAGHVLCSVCFPNAPVELFSKRQDPSVCPGSGTTDSDSETARLGYYSGNFGVCNQCGQRVTIPGRSVKMRKHKKPE